MTIGIYSLYWEEQDLYYIGQSQNIEQRIKSHLSNLISNRHTNSKLQNTYNKYGKFHFCIVQKCTDITELNDAESIWINEFNTLNAGLNILDPRRVLYGSSSGKSKYSKRKILSVFSMLYKTTLAYSYISERLDVPYTLIRDIKTGISHIWLKVEYPDKYKVMENRPMNTIRRPKGYKMLR